VQLLLFCLPIAVKDMKAVNFVERLVRNCTRDCLAEQMNKLDKATKRRMQTDETNEQKKKEKKKGRT
jgi:hypothetical protein